jgi:hypothetical protein
MTCPADKTALTKSDCGTVCISYNLCCDVGMEMNF